MQECGSICRASACPSEVQDYFPGAKNRKAPGRPAFRRCQDRCQSGLYTQDHTSRGQGNDASASTIFGRNN